MPEHTTRISPLAKQIWTVSGVLLSILSQGMAQGFMSVLLDALKDPDSPIKMDLHLASWLASGMPMSIVIGTATATVLMDILGRKMAYIMELLPGIIAMLLMYYATDFTTLMVARLLDGITSGGTGILAAIIIGEYVSPAYRGMFLNLKTACISLGSTIVHSLGHFLHWKTVALIVLVPYGVALVIIYTWKESPAWLASKNRTDECKRAFLWLRGDSAKTKDELQDLIKAQEERATTQLKLTFLNKVIKLFKKFMRKDFLRPVFILICCFTLQEACGRHIVPVYLSDIVKGITGNSNPSFYYTLVIDVIVTISCMCSSILIRFMKTRTLVFSSGISAVFVLSCVCLYLFLSAKDVISKDRPMIPLGLFLMYFTAVNLGCTPLSLSLLGEIIPLEHKPYGIFTISIAVCILVISTLKLFSYLMLYLNIYGTFLVLGVITAIILVILYYTLPETQNKTLQEIEDCMKYGKAQHRGRNDEESSKMLHLNSSKKIISRSTF